MTFDDRLRPARTIAEANWIEAACAGTPGTVGALVPNQYPALLRVRAPDPDVDDWWDAYREVFVAVATAGQRHTARADRSWFSIWEGHGFESGTASANMDGATDVRAVWADEQIPRFDLPHRRYYLVEGRLAAVGDLRYPGVDGWRNPDLMWPHDRRWFVATDVDFWSLYVGGDALLIEEVANAVPTRTDEVTLETPIASEL